MTKKFRKMIFKKITGIILALTLIINHSNGLIPVAIAATEGLVSFSDVKEGLTVAWEVCSAIMDFTSKKPNEFDLRPLFSEIHKISFDQYKLGVALEHLEVNIVHMLNALASQVADSVSFNKKKEQLVLHARRINTAYHLLYQAVVEKHAHSSICHDAKVISSIDADSVPDALQNINFLAASPQTLMFSNLVESMIAMGEKEKFTRCNRPTSFQHELFELYKFLCNVELKAMTVLALSYKVRETCSKESFANNMKGALQTMENRVLQYAQIFKSAMANASRDIRSCAPSVVSGMQYQVLETYQRAIIRNVRELGNETDCRQYSHVRYPANDFPLMSIIDCDRLGRGYYRLCIPPSHVRTSRLYEWFTNTVLGEYFGSNHENCYGSLGRERPIPGLINFDNCVCTGVYHDENPWQNDYPGYYFYSLKAEVADIQENQVVTGVKLSVSDYLIYLEIQVGTAQANFSVTDMKWKPHEIPSMPIDVVERLIFSGLSGEYVALGVEENQAKYVNLDDIYVDKNHVVTGVQLAYHHDPDIELPEQSKSYPSTILLSVQETPYDYLTGKIVQSKSRWISREILNSAEFNDDQHYISSRYELKLTAPDNPLKAKVSSVDSKGRQYMRFRPSDLTKDAGQVTVPFINSGPAESKLGVPLGGVALFHEGETGFGGFLGVKCMTYDLLQHFEDAFTDNDRMEYVI